LNEVWKWGPSIANSFRIGRMKKKERNFENFEMFQLVADHVPVWWLPPNNQDPGQAGGTSNIIQVTINMYFNQV
jgi:hypothetical protein